MTTIAYKRGIIACDKQTTTGSVATRTKKFLETDDAVYFVCGNATPGLMLIEWILSANRDRSELPKHTDTGVIEFNKTTGRIVEWEPGSYLPLPNEDAIAAWGTGRELAIGAMTMGASPEQAIKVASKWDVYSGLGEYVFYSDAARKRLAKTGE